MRDLFLFFVFGTYIGIAFISPFAATLGYLWVDLTTPQAVGYSFLKSISMSMVMGVAAVSLFLIWPEKKSFSLNRIQILLLIFAAWFTLTTTWAVVPDYAWWKWNWAVKTALFAVFAPLVINSRVRFEAFLFTFVLSIALNYLPLAAKTILSGGGYGRAYTIAESNLKLSESSTLAMAAVMAVPLTLALYRNNLLLSKSRITLFATFGLIVSALVGVVGTYARTGLVCIGAYLALAAWRSNHRTYLITAAAFVVLLSIPFIPSQWNQRMETIRNPQNDASASTRLAVWEWTFDYAKEHPLGGGFESYRINTIVSSKTSDGNNPFEDNTRIQHGRAFHSIYFEVLGEHGFVGLFIFLTILTTSFFSLGRIYKRSLLSPSERWLADYAQCMQQALVVLAIGGVFIGIAFQPILMFTISMVAMLIHLERKSARSKL